MRRSRWPKPRNSKGVNLGQITGLAGLDTVSQQLSRLNALAVTTSSNWAIGRNAAAAARACWPTTSPPSRKPRRHGATCRSAHRNTRPVGASIAGLPTLLSGFNGKVAWSMSTVKGDTQDLFLEKVKRQGSALYYENNGKWLPAAVRNETFFVKGQRPIREAVYETRHGALLNSSQALTSGLGLALQTADFKDDKSLDAFFDLSRAQNAAKASDATREIRAIALNMVFADASNIGWQVTGRFPNRREGEGLLPSPGWDAALRLGRLRRRDAAPL